MTHLLPRPWPVVENQVKGASSLLKSLDTAYSEELSGMKRSISLIVFLAVGIFSAGCGEIYIDRRPPPRRIRDVISLHQLANRLDLKIRSSDKLMATLTGENNVVTLFAGESAQVYVNGRDINWTGPIDSVRGMLFVPPSLSGVIQRALPVKATPVRLTKKISTAKPTGGKINLGLIVVDAGHGGNDGGAERRLGSKMIYEKNINLSVAKLLAAELAKLGAKVILTRDTDIFVSKLGRAAIANRARANLFVSIHSNSATNRKAHGHLVFTATRASKKSVQVATSISTQLAAGGIARWSIRPVERRQFTVLVATSCPAVLVELGFMTNSSDLAKLTYKAHQKLLAQKIAAGIAKSLVK